MSSLLVGFLSALLVTNQPGAVSRAVSNTAAPVPPDSAPTDPVEVEYQKLLEADDFAQAEVDKLIRDNEAFALQGAPAPAGDLRERIRVRFAPIQKAYEDFLKRHPQHARARLAYGSFLNDIKDEVGAHEQWEKARQLDPTNPAAWNNLANYYGHNGPVTNSFEYYAKAIALDPNEPVYYHNLGTTVYLFRKDAMEHYHLNEQQVFDKALDLYAKALRLEPANFTLATDIAQTYYGIQPLRTNDALLAWDRALKLARDDIEREGVQVHLARVKLQAGRFPEARRHLDLVTNAMYGELKRRVARSLELKAAEASPPSALPPSSPKP